MNCSKEDVIKMVSGKKKFFLKYFWVSFALYLFSALFIIFGHEMVSEMVHHVWKLDAEHYRLVAVLLMGMWKILIIQFALIPFITLFLADKALKAGEEE